MRAIMPKLRVSDGVFILLAASLTACSSAPSQETSRTESASIESDGAIDVPDLTCASRSYIGRLEYSLRVVPDAGDARHGAAALRRFWLVDGQSYLILQADVAARREAGTVIVYDAAGTFDLRVDGSGLATLVAVNGAGFPVRATLSCDE
jgi:hypothetical protein